MTYTIEKVTTLIGARRYGDNDTNIGFILTDSRSLCFPEETLFFALKSERNDGHNYIPELYRRGVKNFVVTDVPKGYASDYPEANFLKVVNTLEALQRLAERHRDEFNIPIVGITGSNGKTMVKEWLYQLLSPSMFVTRSPRSYNSQIGVPLSVWLMNEQTQVGVFEAGISQPGEMLALRDIIQPTIAVLTNVGAAHQENFSSKEEKCREKLILFHDAETIVYDGDDEMITKMIAEYKDFKGEKLFWSEKNPELLHILEEELFMYLNLVLFTAEFRTNTDKLHYATLSSQVAYLFVESIWSHAALVDVAQDESMATTTMVRTTVHEVESDVEGIDIAIVAIIDQGTTMLSHLHFQSHSHWFEHRHTLVDILGIQS